MNNIVLIGFMGCGKTSVGVRLSYRLKKSFVDTDRLIEKKEEKKVAEIFKELGEGAFRQMETQCIKNLLSQKGNQIISVGGGLPMAEENRILLKKLGMVIYLRVTPKTICTRLVNDKSRPLLQGNNAKEKVEELLAQREPFYGVAADMIVNVDGKNFETIILQIEKAIAKYNKKNRGKKG